MSRKFNPLIPVFAIICFIQISCQSTPQPTIKKTDPIEIVVTSDLFADSVQKLCGDLCEIETLIPNNTNPHIYQFDERTKKSFNPTSRALCLGSDFESNVLKQLQSLGVESISLADSIPTEQILSQNSQQNPHFWLNPELWIKCQDAIETHLISKLPDSKDIISKNKSKFVEELTQLDNEITKLLSSIPLKKRVLITNHNSLQYFAKKYQFQALSAPESNSKQHQDQIKAITKTIIEKQIPVIFVVSGFDPASIREIQKAVRAKGWNLRIGGELTTDSLLNHKSYIDMMRSNAKTIAAGLTQ